MAKYPQYAPDYRVRINGANIPPDLRASVISIHYTDGIEGADRVEITIANEGLQWLDHPLLQVDNRFTFSIGYAPDPLEQVFTGEITGVNAAFPSGGIPTMTIVAQDFLHRLTEGSKDRAFKLDLPTIGSFPLPDPVVVAIAAATDVLIPYPDPVGSALSFLTLLLAYAIDPAEAKRSIRIQSAQSDFDFLSMVARDNGWEMYIDHTMEPQGYVLRFQFLLQDYTPSVTLKWGASLQEFTPRISTVGQIFGVSTRIWVPSIKMEFVIVVGWDFDRASFNLEVYPSIGPIESIIGNKTVVRVDTVGMAMAPKKILSELLPRLNNRQTGSGSTIGNPDIKASRVIRLDGLGDQLGGLYRVTSATHTIDGGGYRTSFEARKEVWFGSIPLPKNPANLVRVQGQSFR
jgi:hypothetical protein